MLHLSRRPLGPNLCRLVVLGALATGCASPDAPKEGLKAALARAEAARQVPPPSTPGEITQPATLRATLRRPAHQSLPLLGALDYSLSLSARIIDVGAEGAGTAVHARFDDVVRLRVAAGGDFSLAHAVDWSVVGDAAGRSGRRCVWVDGAYFTGRRVGPMTRLPVQADEPQGCLDSALAPLATLVDRVLDELSLSAAGTTTVAGRPARQVQGVWRERAVRVPPAVPEAWGPKDKALPSKAIFGPRGPLFVERTDLRGATMSLALDAATGVPLAGELEASFAFRKLSQNGVLQVKLKLEARPGAGAVRAPEGARVWTPRPRPFEVEAALLAGKALRPEAEVALPAPGEAPTLELSADEAALEADWGLAGLAADGGLWATEDAAVLDAAVLDAAVLDAAVPDAAVLDAAVPDAAVLDAAVPDAAVLDAAVPDAAVPDAAVPDVAVPDARPPSEAPDAEAAPRPTQDEDAPAGDWRREEDAP